MSWTYSGNPSKSDLDQVRFLVQDTNAKDKLLNNEEIEFLLELEGSPLKASVKAAETISATFARLCDEAVGQVKVSFSQKFDHYKSLAATLKASSGVKLAMPFAGGLEESQKDVQEEDENRVQPIFTRDLHDHRKTRRKETTGRVITEGVQEEEDP